MTEPLPLKCHVSRVDPVYSLIDLHDLTAHRLGIRLIWFQGVTSRWVGLRAGFIRENRGDYEKDAEAQPPRFHVNESTAGGTWYQV